MKRGEMRGLDGVIGRIGIAGATIACAVLQGANWRWDDRAGRGRAAMDRCSSRGVLRDAQNLPPLRDCGSGLPGALNRGNLAQRQVAQLLQAI
jgi:hypothetical protein